MAAKSAEKSVEKIPAGTADAKAAATRERELDAAISSITKAYGEGAIMRLGDARAQVKIDVIPTGGLAIDLALGVGGIPRGRVVEIYGPESSGKTTLMLHVIANAQKAGGLAAFIDAEHALDPGYAKKLGVNLDDLLVSQPDSGEEALTICETLARSNALDVIVIDSVAALVPKAELEGEMGMATMGMQARLMSQALRKLTAILAKSKTTCIFTNQLREKVGVMFGSPETTPGGKATPSGAPPGPTTMVPPGSPGPPGRGPPARRLVLTAMMASGGGPSIMSIPAGISVKPGGIPPPPPPFGEAFTGIFRPTRAAAGFHWALIRTVTRCRSGVGACSSTTTVAKKPESISFLRNSVTCVAICIPPRRLTSPRRVMARDSIFAPPGAALAMTVKASE